MFHNVRKSTMLNLLLIYLLFALDEFATSFLSISVSGFGVLNTFIVLVSIVMLVHSIVMLFKFFSKNSEYKVW